MTRHLSKRKSLFFRNSVKAKPSSYANNRIKLCPRCYRDVYLYSISVYTLCQCGDRIFNDVDYYISQKGEIKKIEKK